MMQLAGNEQIHRRCALAYIPVEERAVHRPDQLKDGWVLASESRHCDVRRERIEGAGVVYALYGPPDLPSPRRAELRMRDFLMRSGYTFTMGTLGH